MKNNKIILLFFVTPLFLSSGFKKQNRIVIEDTWSGTWSKLELVCRFLHTLTHLYGYRECWKVVCHFCMLTHLPVIFVLSFYDVFCSLNQLVSYVTKANCNGTAKNWEWSMKQVRLWGTSECTQRCGGDQSLTLNLSLRNYLHGSLVWYL